VFYGPSFVDAAVAYSLTAATPTYQADGTLAVTLSATPTFTVGDMFYQNGISFYTPQASGIIVGVAGNVLFLRDVWGSFITPGTGYICAAYPMTVTYAVKSAIPGTSAEWQEAVILFGNLDGASATVTLTGDSGSDAAITLDKTQNQGEARQIRVWPGRTSSYSGIMKLSYSERVAYIDRPVELSGVAWTFSQQGDGVSR
jgi:hypothetical protein